MISKQIALLGVLTISMSAVMIASASPALAGDLPDWYNSVKLSYPDPVRAGQTFTVKWTIPDALKEDNTEVYLNLCHAAGCKKIATVSRFGIGKIKITIPKNFKGPAEYYLHYQHTVLASFATYGKSFTVLPPLATVSSSEVSALFKSVYDRNPTASEKAYWAKRLKDKPEKDYFLGALNYQKAHNIKH